MKTLNPSLLITIGFWFATQVSARPQSYDWTTIAGMPLQSGSADGTNNGVRFRYPRGVTLDGNGGLYVADGSNETIRKLTPAGTNWVSRTLAGTVQVVGSSDGTNSDALFDGPDVIAVGGANTLFVLDTWNHIVRKMSAVGTNWVVTTLAGLAQSGGHADGTNSDARFNGPQGMTIDQAGNLYVGDYWNDLVRKITPMGTNWVVSTIGGSLAISNGVAGVNGDGTNSASRFSNPSGVAADTAGNVFVTDTGSHRIRKIAPLGTNWVVTTIAGSAGAAGTNDGIGSNARFFIPSGIAVDATGGIYVADSGNNLIRKILPVGTNWLVSTVGGLGGVAGSADGIGTSARFNSPLGLAVDGKGNILVADLLNHTIRQGQPPPSLGIIVNGSQVMVSWPVMANGYALETSSALGAGASWIPLTNGQGICDNDFIMTNYPSSTSAFYRLRR